MLRYVKRSLQELDRYASVVRQILHDLPVHCKHRGSTFPALHRRIIEQTQLLLSNAIHAKYYYLFSLYSNSITFEEKQRFLGDYMSKPLFYLINDKEYWAVLEDKLIFSRYFAGSGLPTPKIICALGRNANVDGMPCLRTKSEISSWLERPEAQELFIKPVDTSVAKGVVSLGSRVNGGNSWRRMPTGDEIGLEEILEHVDGWSDKGTFMIVQDRLVPHPDVAEILPNILHTLRIVTWRDGDEVKVLDAILKIGRAGAPADNFRTGGMLAPVEMESGICEKCVVIVEGIAQHRDDHPDSGKRISGLKVPFWHESLDVARRASERCWFHQTIGWDVAVTRDGPMILEGNVWFTPSLNQIARSKGLLSTEWRTLLTDDAHFKSIGLGLFQDWRSRIN